MWIKKKKKGKNCLLKSLQHEHFQPRAIYICDFNRSDNESDERVFMFRTSPLIHLQMCSQNFILISKETHEWLNIDLRTFWHPLCVIIQLISMNRAKKDSDYAVTQSEDEDRGRCDLATLCYLRWSACGSQRPKRQEINTLILDVSDLSVRWHGRRKVQKETKACI